LKNQQGNLKQSQLSLDKPKQAMVTLEREFTITFTSVDRNYMVRHVVALIKSLKIEKEVLHILRGY
jgi:hypothetical protein